jgi:hypothetical protein
MKEMKLHLLGDCRDENLINEIFGSVSDFACLCEEKGNNFIYKGVQITYDEEKDIHSFFKIV